MVFYFSATGNSKYVATKICDEFKGDMIDIATALRNNKLEYNVKDEEKVFFVFPVYYYGLPTIVNEFIEKMKFTGGTADICGIATCAGSPGATDRLFAKLFKDKGMEVKGFYKVKMVENYVAMFKISMIEEQIMILRRSEEEIKDAIDSIKFNYRVSYKSGIGQVALSKVAQRVYLSGRKTKKFYAKDNCTGCGYCSEICSCNIISMENNKPVWEKEQCSHCMACINRCPVKAIEYGKATVNRGRYVNPNVK